jgi:peptidyl-prolyl cis-trans isomerase A (cyclophilin A)
MARRKKAGELRDSEVECYYCNTIIPEDAVRCPNCGKLFSAAKKMMAFAVVVVIVLAGMSYFVYSTYFDTHEGGTNDISPVDTDGDGYTDAQEIASGTDPTDSADHPTNVAPTGKTIIFELKETEAPNTCANFKKYANDQYFDGLIFHRVIDGFMIQGGGFYPDLTQKTATYPPIALEISPLRHTDGAVAMARTSDPNSATSQFYICDGPQTSLDDQYAVFGYVTSGMEHVRAISAVQTGSESGMSDVPVNDVTIQSARLSTIGGKTYVTLIVTY